MKLKCLLFVWGIFCLSFSEVKAQYLVSGLGTIKAQNVIRCGTNLSMNAFTQKNTQGNYEGIDPTICSILSLAIFGTPDNYEMLHIDADKADKAISSGKIDVMLGNSYITASKEIDGYTVPAATIYHDRLVMLAKTDKKPTSMLDLQNENVCIVPKSPDIENFEEYLRKYNLSLRTIKFANFQSAKASLLMNRCKLLVGDETTLSAIRDELKSRKDIFLLPEEIDSHPIYILVSKNNADLQSIVKWVINALIMAEENDITSKNIAIMTGENNLSLRNLLGTNPQIWKKLGLQSNWVKKAIKLYGNYGEIYEKNLGSKSPLKLPREKSNLIKDGGVFKSQAFL